MLHGQPACLSKESLYASADSKVGVERYSFVLLEKNRPRVPKGGGGGGGGGGVA